MLLLLLFKILMKEKKMSNKPKVIMKMQCDNNKDVSTMCQVLQSSLCMHYFISSSQQGSLGGRGHCPHFTHEETEAWRNWLTCSVSVTQFVAKSLLFTSMKHSLLGQGPTNRLTGLCTYYFARHANWWVDSPS